MHGAVRRREFMGELDMNIHVLGVIINMGNGAPWSGIFVWNY